MSHDYRYEIYRDGQSSRGGTLNVSVKSFSDAMGIVKSECQPGEVAWLISLSADTVSTWRYECPARPAALTPAQIESTIGSQRFADWYGAGGQYERYITGEDTSIKATDIHDSIKRLFSVK